MRLARVSPRYMRAVQLLVLRDFATEPDVWDKIDKNESFVMIQHRTPKVLGCLLVDTQKSLAYLVVRDGFRGRGIGSELMKKCTATDLTCVSTLIPFYQRFGFQQLSTLDDGRIIMRRDQTFTTVHSDGIKNG